MPLKDAETFVAMLFDVVNDGLMKDKLVKVKGLGTFKVASVKDRESVNVNTGERVLIEGHDKITFTPDAALRDFVNKPFAQFETVIVKDGVDFSDLDNQKETETPEVPETPKTPDTPETPENKEPTETQENPETPDALLSTAAESTEPETSERSETQEALEVFAAWRLPASYARQSRFTLPHPFARATIIQINTKLLRKSEADSKEYSGFGGLFSICDHHCL
jgi:nucleoid DNA-binding protein